MKIGTAPGRCKEAGHLFFPCQPYPKTAAFVVPTRSITMPENNVTVEIAQHVLWHFGDVNLGQQPGQFVQRLLRTMAVADNENMTKLLSVFPGYANAFIAVGREHWGLEWLRRMVKAADPAVPQDTLPDPEDEAVRADAAIDAALERVFGA